jgi:hypothetical protein
MENLLKFLIMENLPVCGDYVSKEKLMRNVILDTDSLKKTFKLSAFESTLSDLHEKQFIFKNEEKGLVAVTQYGINKCANED